jgi:hypothetical protein
MEVTIDSALFGCQESIAAHQLVQVRGLIGLILGNVP